MRIDIYNPSGININFIKKLSTHVLKKEGKKNVGLSIVFVDENKIKELNKKYLKRNSVTDVLSFTWLEDKKDRELVRLSFLRNILGEIVICLSQVKKNAEKFNQPFEKELAKVIIHGILHLLGYEHKNSKKEKDYMFQKEEIYLSELWPKVISSPV